MNEQNKPSAWAKLRANWNAMRQTQAPGMHADAHPIGHLSPLARTFRPLFRNLARWVETYLTRTTIEGAEHLAQDRPVIFAANHASTYDAILLIAHLPEKTELVGPGDFKLLFPADLLIPLAGIVRIKRAALNKESLRRMSGALESGLHLALFPEGGTWEKRLDDVKAGVAYLSYQQQVPVVPISFGGTYQVWGKILRLQRPHITIHIGEPIPPLQIADRKERAQRLETASIELMRRIYAHLPAVDQARYDVAERQAFHGRLIVTPDTLERPLPDFPVLAELVSKPNLLSPLINNAKLPLKPLTQPEVAHPAAAFVIAAERMKAAFAGNLSGYLQYRLGDEKALAGMAELDALQEIALAAHHSGLALRFVPRVDYSAEPLPPNR